MDPLWNSLVVGGFYAGKPFLGTVGMIGTNYTDDHLATGGCVGGWAGGGRLGWEGTTTGQLGFAPSCLLNVRPWFATVLPGAWLQGLATTWRGR